MPRSKTATLNLRIDPEIKDAAEAAAKRQRRSLTAFVENLILTKLENLETDGTAASMRSKGKRSAAERADASAMAERAIENLTDTSAASAEQSRRKKKLLQGPKEFREMRQKARKAQ